MSKRQCLLPAMGEGTIVIQVDMMNCCLSTGHEATKRRLDAGIYIGSFSPIAAVAIIIRSRLGVRIKFKQVVSRHNISMG